MRKLITLVLGCILAAALTTNTTAQTVGGNTDLNSKTWTWTAVDDAVGIPATTLFTPAETGDYLITAYLTVNPVGNNGACPEPILTFMDEFGTQQDYVVQLATTVMSGAAGFNFAGFNFGNGLPSIAAGVTTIHVIADTAVSIHVFDTGTCQTGASGSYDFILGKVKLNP